MVDKKRVRIRVIKYEREESFYAARSLSLNDNSCLYIVRSFTN